MIIVAQELGNQQSTYFSHLLAGVEPKLLKVKPDLFIKSRLQEGDPSINPMLEQVMPLITGALAARGDLLVIPFPSEIDPAILIADPLRDRGYHDAVKTALEGMVGKGLVNAVEFNRSFYKY